MQEKLSEHFTLKEMTRSVTAARHHIDNTPDANAKENLRYLCNHVLEPLREEYGAPIIINSGFRCVAVNQLVGGVKNSQHLKGEAADIHLPSIAAGQQMFRILKQQRNFDQLIWEHTRDCTTYWIHVSCKRQANRHQVLKLSKAGLSKV